MLGNENFAERKNIFNNQSQNHFGDVVRQRVDSYFQENQLSKHWDTKLKLKVAFLLSSYVGLTFMFLMIPMSAPGSILVLMMIGFLTACIGFNVGHDATHGALSKNPKINNIFRHAFELIGASSYTWNLSHNIAHHTYTNIIGIDRDLNSVSALRFFPKPNPKWFHRFQHIYCFFLYCMTSLIWVLKKDFSQIFDKSLSQWTSKPHPPSAYITLALSKGLHFTLFLILPVVLLDWSVIQAVAGFVLLHSVAGLMLAVIFQLAHVVQGPHMVPQGHKVGCSWAEHQLNTTSDFAKNNPVIGWICGGLNFQIEHHLFPRICHIHYPKIEPIVKRTALECGVPYNEHSTFFQALRSHLFLMKQFGQSHDKTGVESVLLGAKI